MRAGLVALAIVAIVSGCSAPAGPIESGSPSPTPSPVSTAIPEGARVAFYGDSYTVGFGATDPSRRWSTLVSAHRGWIELNDAQGGLGFLLNRPSFGPGDRVDQIIAQKPDAVVVMLGLNDVLGGYGDDARVKERIDSDLSRLAAGLGEAPLIVLEPMWFKAERPPGLQVEIDWVAQEARAVGARYIPGSSFWLDDGRAEWMYWDGLHPNDAGYAELARRFEAAIGDLGL